jgi:hypothetical protein
MAEEAGGFLARWALRKEQVRSRAGVAVESIPAVPPPAVPVAPAPANATGPVAQPVPEVPAAEPLPTMADVALLTRESDYARFVTAGVDEGVKRAAMKKLFSDPHFNVMDGLDTYIDDYGKPDPIPLAMLRQLNQSKFLRLFDDDDDEKNAEPATAAAATDTTTEPANASDDDPDLQLQQDHAVGQPGPDQGAGA